MNSIIHQLYNDGNTNDKIRSLFIESAAIVRYDYEIHKSFGGGLGGCISVDEWFKKKYTDDIDNYTKNLLKEYLESKSVIGFIQYVWDDICMNQFDTLLEKEQYGKL